MGSVSRNSKGHRMQSGLLYGLLSGDTKGSVRRASRESGHGKYRLRLGWGYWSFVPGKGDYKGVLRDGM